jgi:hypothetical protein
MCDDLLPDLYRVPKCVQWAQRKRFVSILVQLPSLSPPVMESSAVHMMSEDGLSVSLIFRTVSAGNDPDIWALRINLFDCARFGSVEGPTVCGSGNCVKLGFVKAHPGEWPRLTRETRVSSFAVAYDWNLDGSYEEDEESNTDSDDSTDSDVVTGGAGVQTCDECGEEFVELEDGSHAPAASSISNLSGCDQRKLKEEEEVVCVNELKQRPTSPRGWMNMWLLSAAVIVGGMWLSYPLETDV